MKQVCIVTNNKNTYFTRRLIDVVGDSDVSFWNPWQEDPPSLAKFYLVRSSGVHDPHDFDLESLNKIKNTTLINPLRSLKLCRDKITQEIFFKELGISTVAWKRVSDFKVSDFEQSEVLVKPIRGQGGWGIEAFHEKDFSDWYKQKKITGDLEYLIQPYLKDFEEFRVFFIKSSFMLVLKRTPIKGVRANFAQEGGAVLASLPEILIGPVTKIIASTGAVYGAIDFLVSPTHYYILELNTVPGIEQLEEVSGIDVMKVLVDTLLS